MNGGPLDINQLADEYYGKIYKLCLFHLGDKPEAEEMTHEIFIVIARKLSGFRGEAPVFSWMRRIALNRISNYRRRRRVIRFFSLDEDPSVEFVVDEQPDPALRMEFHDDERQKFRKLEHCLETLSFREKTALFFCHYEGLKRRETAEIMGTSVSAVDGLVHKALKKMRGCVEEA